MQVGNEVIFGDGELQATVRAVQEDGNRVVEFHYEGIFLEVLERLGKMPLPPYIKAELQDQERYQTVYSKNVGSAAAPTAGLHFTNDLLEKIRTKGIKTAFVTLHVGLGTFRPVKAEEISEHHMHSELCMITEETARILNETKREGGRVICVGTTSCRTLESLVNEDGSFEEKAKWTEIFIFPGYNFKAMDGLITNFHLPESTLIMLVSAFTGYDNTMNAYKTAVYEKYRFFSFGESMCIL
jgi:S-adenosylmethionine:tRNA ribosyltransferase-isomerase